MNISRKILKKFIEQAGERLTGDWIILGGSVLHLLGIDARITTDIDIAGPESATQKDSLELMEIAVSLNLPVEAVNQAASYFLYKEKDWQKSIVLVHEGEHAKIYRPNINLYILLKMKRLTESDLQDCLAMIDFSIKKKEALQKQKLIKMISGAIDHEKNDGKRERLMTLKNRLKLTSASST